MDFATAMVAFSRRRRRWILLLAATGATSYAAYIFYHHPSVVQKRRTFSKLLHALTSLTDAVSTSADAVSLIAGDLHRFLESNSDDVPQSIKQLSKITCSDDFSRSISSISEALTSGIDHGIGSGADPAQSQTSFTNRVLDKLLSDAGTGFVSVVAGSFARNLVLGFYVNGEPDPDSVPNWVKFICTNECRELIVESIQRFVSTLVAVYLDKTIDINMYDQLFSGLTNPKHESRVKEMMVSICNGAVETLVKTSHEVLARSNNPQLPMGKTSELDQRRKLSESKEKNCGNWINQVSTMLAMPKNRKFLLDVTGKITFETVRSFVDFVMWKLNNGAKTGIHVVHEQTVRRGLEVMRYVSAKSVVIVTICITLCVRILTGTGVLMPA